MFTNTGGANGGVDYLITGGGSIGGSTGITLAGSLNNSDVLVGGNVFLATANTFSGAVAVNAGQLVLENYRALGNTSNVNVALGAALGLQSGSGTMPAGAYGLTVGTSAAISTTLSGNGLSGNGALVSVNGVNTYAGAIIIAAGGATIGSLSNSNGDGLTLSGGITANGTVSFSGTGPIAVSTNGISGNGGLIYSGTGTLTLAASNSYIGATQVNSGTLRVTGSLASGTTATVGGANASGMPTLSGGGTINGSIVISGNSGGSVAGNLAPSSGTGSAFQTLNINGNLTLNPGAELSYNLGSATDAGNDLVSNVANLTLDGGGALNINDYNGSLQTNGVYDLINYSSSSGPLGTWKFNGPGNYNYSLSATGNGGAGQLDLTVTVASSSFTWNHNSSDSYAMTANWSPAAPSGGPSGAGVTATFGNSTTGSIAISLSGSVTLGTLNFNNSSTSYTLSGGTVVLNNNGNGASVNVTNSAAEPFIASNLTLAEPAGSSNLTTTFNIAGSTSSLEVAGAIGESTPTGQQIVLTGGGSLQLDNNNAYTGGTTIESGTLVAGNNTNSQYLTFGSGPLTFNPGNGQTATLSVQYPLVINNLSEANTATGTARIIVAPSTGLTVNQTISSSYAGTINVGTSGSLAINVNAGTLALNG